jgi:hypothetical protein
VADPGHAGQEILYVSTVLGMWRTDQPQGIARDFQINDTCYRRLDPEYYAWLRSRMHMAKLSAAAGHLPQESFEELQARFNAIHGWASRQFGKDRLLDAIDDLDAREYHPPVAEPWQLYRPWPSVSPANDGERVFVHHVSERAMALVHAIADLALALGWTHEALYQSQGHLRFPFGQDCGLVCFIGVEDRIGDVAGDAIEIIGPPPRELRCRFYKPNAPLEARKDNSKKVAGGPLQIGIGRGI